MNDNYQLLEYELLPTSLYNLPIVDIRRTDWSLDTNTTLDAVLIKAVGKNENRIRSLSFDSWYENTTDQRTTERYLCTLILTDENHRVGIALKDQQNWYTVPNRFIEYNAGAAVTYYQTDAVDLRDFLTIRLLTNQALWIQRPQCNKQNVIQHVRVTIIERQLPYIKDIRKRIEKQESKES